MVASHKEHFTILDINSSLAVVVQHMVANIDLMEHIVATDLADIKVLRQLDIVAACAFLDFAGGFNIYCLIPASVITFFFF